MNSNDLQTSVSAEISLHITLPQNQHPCYTESTCKCTPSMRRRAQTNHFYVCALFRTTEQAPGTSHVFEAVSHSPPSEDDYRGEKPRL